MRVVVGQVLRRVLVGAVEVGQPPRQRDRPLMLARLKKSQLTSVSLRPRRMLSKRRFLADIYHDCGMPLGAIPTVAMYDQSRTSHLPDGVRRRLVSEDFA